MTLDVLFIDDDYTLADDWAKLMQESMDLKTQAMSDPAEVLEFVRTVGVKVVVIDQKMPLMSGTVLGKRIGAIDSRVRRILLSGEASPTEVAEAYDSGFHRSIHKNSGLAELPSAITHYLIEYHRNVSREAASTLPVLIRRSGLFGIGHRVVYRMLSVDNIDPAFHVNDQWISRERIDAGESSEIELSLEWTRSARIQFEASTVSSFDVGLSVSKLIKLSTAVKAEIKNSVTQETQLSVARSVKVRKTVSLAAEPSDPDQLHVKARSYQITPVYVKVYFTMSATCGCCGNQSISKASMLLPSKRYATRHVDYLSDGSVRTTQTGIEEH